MKALGNKVRRLVRRLPEPVQIFLNDLRFIVRSGVVLPLQGTTDYIRAKHFPGPHQGADDSFWIHVAANRHLRLRRNGTDLRIFEQIFLIGDCAVPFEMEPAFIVDGGAHIGCASVFFALRYPGAQIVAVEADENNFNLLTENIEAFPKIRAVHAAIWCNTDGVQIKNPDDEAWTFQVETIDSHIQEKPRIKSVTIDALLDRSGKDTIDLLKLDIEGAEVEVFTAETGWLARTENMIIELHDRFRPGCEKACRDAIRPYHFVEHRTTFNRIWRKRTA